MDLRVKLALGRDMGRYVGGLPSAAAVGAGSAGELVDVGLSGEEDGVEEGEVGHEIRVLGLHLRQGPLVDVEGGIGRSEISKKSRVGGHNDGWSSGWWWSGKIEREASCTLFVAGADMRTSDVTCRKGRKDSVGSTLGNEGVHDLVDEWQRRRKPFDQDLHEFSQCVLGKALVIQRI